GKEVFLCGSTFSLVDFKYIFGNLFKGSYLFHPSCFLRTSIVFSTAQKGKNFFDFDIHSCNSSHHHFCPIGPVLSCGIGIKHGSNQLYSDCVVVLPASSHLYLLSKERTFCG